MKIEQAVKVEEQKDRSSQYQLLRRSMLIPHQTKLSTGLHQDHNQVISQSQVKLNIELIFAKTESMHLGPYRHTCLWSLCYHTGLWSACHHTGPWSACYHTCLWFICHHTYLCSICHHTYLCSICHHTCLWSNVTTHVYGLYVTTHVYGLYVTTHAES